MMQNTLDDERRILAETIFYSSDFKDGLDAKVWWQNEFKEASKMSDDDLKKWAGWLLETGWEYDFKDEVYYLRDEIMVQLKRILNNGK